MHKFVQNSGPSPQGLPDHLRHEQEAEEVLFQDGPQSRLGKSSANFLETVDPIGILFPYIRTPLRLLERGLLVPYDADTENPIDVGANMVAGE